jgi:hypothetical protein
MQPPFGMPDAHQPALILEVSTPERNCIGMPEQKYITAEVQG